MLSDSSTISISDMSEDDVSEGKIVDVKTGKMITITEARTKALRVLYRRILRKRIAILIINGFLLINAAFMIYIGSEYDCEDNRPGLWMIVDGSICLFITLFIFVFWIKTRVIKVNREGLYFFYFILFVWLCIGTAWIFKRSITDNCSHLMVTYSQVVIISRWSIIGFIILISICGLHWDDDWNLC